MTSDDLLKRLDDRDKEIAPGNLYGLAAARIRELEAELAYFKGFHDGVCKDGTHVIVPVEPTEAMIDAGALYRASGNSVPKIYRAMIRAAQPERNQGE